MAIKSTGMSIKSTGMSTKSSGGGSKSVLHSDGNPHPQVAHGDSDAAEEGHGVVEYTEHVVGSGGPESTVGEGFKGNDAAHEHVCKHPSSEYDSAMVKGHKPDHGHGYYKGHP
jgi:hypothetical protein